MSDLTDRLRDDERSEWGICYAAANEIDRLTAELAQAMKERSRAIAVGSDMEQEVERLREQVAGWIKENGPGGWIDALREAIQHYEAALKLSWPEGAKGGAFDCWNSARAALKGEA